MHTSTVALMENMNVDECMDDWGNYIAVPSKKSGDGLPIKKKSGKKAKRKRDGEVVIRRRINDESCYWKLSIAISPSIAQVLKWSKSWSNIKFVHGYCYRDKGEYSEVYFNIYLELHDKVKFYDIYSQLPSTLDFRLEISKKQNSRLIFKEICRVGWREVRGKPYEDIVEEPPEVDVSINLMGDKSASNIYKEKNGPAYLYGDEFYFDSYGNIHYI